MPTIEENKTVWDSIYNWDRMGNEWSTAWGDESMQWY